MHISRPAAATQPSPRSVHAGAAVWEEARQSVGRGARQQPRHPRALLRHTRRERRGLRQHVMCVCLFSNSGTNMVLFCLQNIDTDQIIPAEYLTLVPSKVSAGASGEAPSKIPHPLR